MGKKLINRNSQIKSISNFLNKEYKIRRKNAVKTIINLNVCTISRLRIILKLLKNIYILLCRIEDIPFNMYELLSKLRKILRYINNIDYILDDAYYTNDNHFGINQKIVVISRGNDKVNRVQYTDHRLSSIIVFEPSIINIDRLGLSHLKRFIEDILESIIHSHQNNDIKDLNTDRSITYSDNKNNDKNDDNNNDQIETNKIYLIKGKLEGLFKNPSLKVDDDFADQNNEIVSSGKEKECGYSPKNSDSTKEKECGYDNSKSSKDNQYLSEDSESYVDENLIINTLETFVEKKLSHHKYKVRNAMYIIGIEYEEHKSQIDTMYHIL